MASEETKNLRDWADGVRDRIFWAANAIESAEQQLATERERHKSMAADYEKIAKGEHPRYWTMEKGDVLFRPTGDCRPPFAGEWYPEATGFFKATSSVTTRAYPIYRRIDSPAAAQSGFAKKLSEYEPSVAREIVSALEGFCEKLKSGEAIEARRADGTKAELFADSPAAAAVEVSPPVSEQEGERAKYRLSDRNQPPGHHALLDDKSKQVLGLIYKIDIAVRVVHYLNGTSPEHATIREQAEEIERLNKLLTARDEKCVALLETITSLRSQLQQANEQGEKRKWAMQTAFEFLASIDFENQNQDHEESVATAQGYLQDALNPPAPAEASEGSTKSPDRSADSQPKQSAGGPAEPVNVNGTGETDVTARRDEQNHEGLAHHPLMEVVQASAGSNSPHDYVLAIHWSSSRKLTRMEAESAADWLNRRAEVEAQLSKYKRDAEERAANTVHLRDWRPFAEALRKPKTEGESK